MDCPLLRRPSPRPEIHTSLHSIASQVIWAYKEVCLPGRQFSMLSSGVGGPMVDGEGARAWIFACPHPGALFGLRASTPLPRL